MASNIKPKITAKTVLKSSRKLNNSRTFEKIPAQIDTSWIITFLEQKRFVIKHIETLKNSISSKKEISHLLEITPKTFNTYFKDISKIKTSTKEHIIMLISLMNHGKVIFGSTENFNEWLRKPNLLLDNKTPLSYLNTNNGIRFIDDRLTGMEYGDNI